MAEPLTDTEKCRFREAFALFDMDGDGVITTEELEELLKALGQNPTPEDIDLMVEEFGIDDTRAIHLGDFLSIVARVLENTDNDEELREAFRAFDHEGEGFISASELKYNMTNRGNKLTDDEFSEMIRDIEINNDGEIVYEHFVEMMIPRRDEEDEDNTDGNI